TLLVSVVQTVLTLALAALLFRIDLHWHRMPFVFLAAVGGTAGWFFLYSIFALSTRRNDIFNTVTSILYFVLLFASNMFYPLEPLPKWFKMAALANPITWQVDCFRWGTIGIGSTRQVALESAGFLLFTVASFFLAARFLQQQE
ncbi:MAG TPA: ABC transporter permease, partial [Armatimonadota bacterium]|nr:ABC transporter permease [Armatimonadota bacterium]